MLLTSPHSSHQDPPLGGRLATLRSYSAQSIYDRQHILHIIHGVCFFYIDSNISYLAGSLSCTGKCASTDRESKSLEQYLYDLYKEISFICILSHYGLRSFADSLKLSASANINAILSVYF